MPTDVASPLGPDVAPSATYRAEARALADRIGQRQAIHLDAPMGTGKTALLMLTAAELTDPLVVQVAQRPDAGTRALLELARQAGEDALETVDHALRSSEDALDSALSELERHIAGRPLLVDDLDVVRPWGVPFGIGFVYAERAHRIRGFLERNASLATSRTPCSESPRFEMRRPPDAAPVTVHSMDTEALWQSQSPRRDAFDLAVTLRLVFGRDDAGSEASSDANAVRERIWEQVPQLTRELTSLLSLHSGPCSTEILYGLDAGYRRHLALAHEIGMVRLAHDRAWLSSTWTGWCRARLGPELRRQGHLDLARAFLGGIRPSDPNARLLGPLILDACQHFAAAKDWRSTRDTSRYGAVHLLSLARSLSHDQRFDEAAEVYAAVLDMDRQENAAWLGRRARAYARHYYHYNRYKSDEESLVETSDGYRRAREDWPENALFRSRSIVARFLLDQPLAAIAELREALDRVPEHPEKDNLLFGRTAERLLRRGRVEAALVVIGSTETRSFGLRAILRDILDGASAGWTTKRLWTPEVEVRLHRTVRVRVVQAGSEAYASRLEAVDGAVARGSSGLDAYRALIELVRDRAQHYLTTLSHTLTGEERMQKRVWLGLVDVVASRLLPNVRETAWVMGRVVIQGERHVFELTDCDIGSLELGDVPTQALARSEYRLARVKAGPAGEPVGPVLELEAPLSRNIDELYARWHERLVEDE